MSASDESMTTTSVAMRPRPRPTVVTSGFTTVDILIGEDFQASPGGTAVNVAASLATLGWNASVVGTIGDDPAAMLLTRVLSSDGVDTSHLRHDKSWKTPIVVQEERHGDHEWRFSCPICGAKYAKHRPSPESYADVVASQRNAPDVFFFDRVSLFTLRLAGIWRRQGSLIVFEPAALGRSHLFDRAVAVADLVKFSSERGRDFRGRLFMAPVALLETLGEGGARFRLNDRSPWSDVPPKQIDTWIDSAGAGDWTTAGTLNTLFRSGTGVNLSDARPGLWAEAVSEGQRLGALACGWRGVRQDKPLTLLIDELELFACPETIGRSATSADAIETTLNTTRGAPSRSQE